LRAFADGAEKNTDISSVAHFRLTPNVRESQGNWRTNELYKFYTLVAGIASIA